MTKTRLKELQTEIARLEKLDNEITNRINNEENSSPDGAGFTGNERRNLQRAAENIFNL